MTKYSPEYREAILHRILPPNSEKLSDVAKDTGIPIQTLSTWKTKASESDPFLELESDDNSNEISNDEKFNIVIATASMNETEIGEYARSKGLFVEQISNWRLICSHAFDNFSKERKNAKAILKEKDNKIKVLEADLDNKNKALAEMAAHLVLAKKTCAIWGDQKDE